MSGIYLKLFVDCLEKYRKLNDAEFGRLVRAALTYKATGEETKLMGREELLWDGMKLDIDRDNKAYSETISARSAAGKMGAAKRWQNMADDGKNGKCHFEDGKNGQDKDKDKDKDKDIIPPTPLEGEGKEENCKQIIDLYHSVCVSFPKVRDLSEARKKAIRARMKTYTVENFRTVFENAESSSFLKGANDRNWTATFDWLISDKNMAKVLDGNYVDKPKSGKKEPVPGWQSGPRKIDEWEREAIRRIMEEE